MVSTSGATPARGLLSKSMSDVPTRPRTIVALGLGSNLAPAACEPFSSSEAADPRARALEGALSALAARGVRPLQASRLYESAPLDAVGDHGPFLNACVLAGVSTSLDEVLAACTAVERLAGRTSKGDRRPRPLDIDILCAWVDDGTWTPIAVDEPSLVVPHPRLATRLFVLRPLVDVAADHQLGGVLRERTPRELLAELDVSPQAGDVRETPSSTWFDSNDGRPG